MITKYQKSNYLQKIHHIIKPIYSPFHSGTKSQLEVGKNLCKKGCFSFKLLHFNQYLCRLLFFFITN